MSLVRLTLNRESRDILVESGEVFYRDLTPEEQKELKILEGQLANFQDFTTAEKLQDEQRVAVMEKKRRYTELQQLPTTPQIEWKMVDPSPKSILLMMRQGRPDDVTGYSVEYVENLPEFLFEKMTSTDITLNLVGAPTHLMDPEAGEPQKQEAPPMAKNRVEAKLYEIQDKLSKPWIELVEIEVKETLYEIRAKWTGTKRVWLDKDYRPIDDAMIKDLGGKWISKGKGDKDAHWEVPR